MADNKAEFDKIMDVINAKIQTIPEQWHEPKSDELEQFKKSAFYHNWYGRFHSLGLYGVLAIPNTTFEEWLWWFHEWAPKPATWWASGFSIRFSARARSSESPETKRGSLSSSRPWSPPEPSAHRPNLPISTKKCPGIAWIPGHFRGKKPIGRAGGDDKKSQEGENQIRQEGLQKEHDKKTDAADEKGVFGVFLRCLPGKKPEQQPAHTPAHHRPEGVGDQIVDIRGPEGKKLQQLNAQ